MHESFTILLNHGYLVVFVWVFADQAGLPLPSFPVLLAAGALAHAGSLNLFAVIALATLAAILPDSLWFELGRHRGGSVLKFICRTSLEPDSCVGRTQQTFSRRGTWTLVVSKFVPGLNIVAAPMAGISGVSRLRFLALNAAGSLAFAVLFVSLGYLFSRQLEQVLALAAETGHWFLIAVFALFIAYLAIKYARRARFIRLLRVARISPDELRDKLVAGTEVAIVDLRLPLDFAAAPQTLPGALRLAPEEVASRHQEIPRDRDIVLYCSCPDESTSTRAALLLKQYGIHRVRPLAGGYDTWLQKQFPLLPEAGSLKPEMILLTGNAILNPDAGKL
ncbi:MAG: VTT domain-containing protein [Verrucomicrobia bacterium]|nr:VTT domain-containing protein [Verrucomicrobiota bacterium]